jgi:group I intron endonuclease
MQQTYIYELIDPRNGQTRYVGKANNPETRLLEHLREEKNTHKCNWIKNLKKEGLQPELNILEQCGDDWQFWERWYIDLYKSWGFELTNIAQGGIGFSDPTGDIRRKISQTLTGTKQKEETKLKRIESRKEYYTNNPDALKERNAKTAATLKQQGSLKWTPELREKACIIQKEASKKRQHAGAILWKEKGLAHPQFKVIIQYDMNGNIIQLIDCVEKAGQFGTRRKKLSAYCLGTSLPHDGYVYRYLKTEPHHLPNTIESVMETVIKIRQSPKHQG